MLNITSCCKGGKASAAGHGRRPRARLTRHMASLAVLSSLAAAHDAVDNLQYENCSVGKLLFSCVNVGWPWQCADTGIGTVQSARTGRVVMIMTWAAVIGAVVVYVCLHRWMQRGSEDPKTWPMMGSQLEVLRNQGRVLPWLTEFFSERHRTVKLRSFSRSTFFTVHPPNVEYILKTNFYNFPKGEEFHNRHIDLLGNGILNTDGEMWKSQRKLASFEFSCRNLKDLASLIYKKGALKLLEGLTTSPQGVNIQIPLLDMAFSTICEMVLGRGTYDPLNFPVSSFENVEEITTRRYVFSCWKLQRFLNIGSERLLRQELSKLNHFLYTVIRDREQQRMETQHKAAALGKQDLLSRFMLPKLEGMFTEDQLRDVLINFLMAGRDTVATTLMWFLYCMCIHQDKQQKVFEELIAVAPTTHHPKAPPHSRFKEYVEHALTYDVLQNRLHYLHAALSETLRLYPVVPWDGKMTMRDDVLPDGTKVKAGDQVAYFPYAMGRMTFLWGEDAIEFKPERWLDQNGRFQPQSPFKFAAFQAGPRMCLGRDAAYLQMKITAALLLRFYEFKLMPNHPVIYKMLMVMTMKHGLKVNILAR